MPRHLPDADRLSDMAAEKTVLGPLDIRRVMAAIPHRYPMLLVDRVLELVIDERISAIKAVTINEPFFNGHFPGRPIMPGVLIVEALAQAAGVLAVESLGLAGSGKLVYFMSIDDVKFRTPVEPGVLLRLDVAFVQKRASVCKFEGKAYLGDKLAAQANFTAMIADPPKD
jgi:3-hydroxyacyl-[acyl-carrier-protein] dehydratase